MSRQVLITVRRPNGDVETVDLYPRLQGMTDHVFETIKRDTKAGGRGDVLSYEVIDTDTRTVAEREYADAQELVAKAEAAANRGTNNAETIRLEGAADRAVAEWRAKYPTEAAEKDALYATGAKGEPTNEDAQIAGER